VKLLSREIFLKKNLTTGLKILVHWDKNGYKYFKYSKNMGEIFYSIFKAVGIFQIIAFCLPESNAAIERVFSLMTTTWIDVRNQTDMKTVESCLVTNLAKLYLVKLISNIR